MAYYDNYHHIQLEINCVLGIGIDPRQRCNGERKVEELSEQIAQTHVGAASDGEFNFALPFLVRTDCLHFMTSYELTSILNLLPQGDCSPRETRTR